MSTNIANKIIQYMLEKKYTVFTSPKEYNIVYLEGVNQNFTLNSDTPNQFNDRRLIIEIPGDGVPIILGNWEATTEPGSHYTFKPMNQRGAARIKFGQYRAWKIGIHGNSEPHESLIQTGGTVTVHRDANKDMIRPGDELDTGWFGINQHWGYDMPTNNVGLASAGCLVGKTRQGHREFMAIIKTDKRYVADRNFIFTTTIIAGNDLLKNIPART
jgi:hypothetical protein